MKKLLMTAVVAAVAALGAPVWGAEKYNVVRIERLDGVTEQLLLDEALNISLGENNSLLLIHPEITVEYELGEVGGISFDYAPGAQLYDGDHESAIDQTPAPERLIQITAEAITAGADDSIAAYDLKGRTVASAKGSLELTRLPAGAVYIVRIGSTSLKIKR